MLENAASVKASLMRALTFCLTVNELQDSADCMQMVEVKTAIKETGATAKAQCRRRQKAMDGYCADSGAEEDQEQQSC